ncbi:MAG: NAD(P)-dependent oxidoreductase [Acidimicrobiales bacterium]
MTGGAQVIEAGGSRTLGWIGTGRMGAEMVRRLLRSGCDLAVYNRTRSKAEPLAAEGAKLVDTPAELAIRDVVFITVGGSDDLRDVVLGESGLLSAGRAPGIVVDSSTVSAEVSAEVRERLAEKGASFLAAPVSGNPRVARAGRLTTAVSGPREAFDAVAGYFLAFGPGATYVGEGEVARLVKLCHNLVLGVVAQSMAEVTLLAERGGVSRQAFLQYLNRSVMGSVFSTYKTPQYVNLDYRATFTSELLRKDFDLGLGAARALEVPMPVAALVHQLVQGLIGLGYGQSDFAALLEQQARSAGMTLESEHAEIADGLEPRDQG